jgi:molecular chaperone HscB
MSGTNPFELLGVPKRFDLDARVVRTAWMRRAADAHPDADGALDPSLAINEAYRKLCDPATRATALLLARNAPAVDERRLPDGFLLEMVALRERVDEAAGDAALLAELRAEADGRRSEAFAEIANAFSESGQGESLSMDVAQRVVTALNVARSFDRMLEQLDRESGLSEA